MTSWITLYPRWYVQERARLARRYPGFWLSEAALSDGILAYAGELCVNTSNEGQRFPVLLVYQSETPYRYPSVTPILRLPTGDDWRPEAVRAENVRWMPRGWRRHQMADGALCLIEGDARDAAEQLSGEAVLKRARRVFRALVLGEGYPFPDSREAELEEHFRRGDDILLGDAFYDPGLVGGGTFYAIETLDTLQRFPTFVEQEIGGDDVPRRLYVGMHVTGHGSTGQLLTTEWRTERSEAIRAAFPFVAHQKLQFERQLTDGDPLEDHSIRGPWFDLRSETEPIRTVRDLEELLVETGVIDPLATLLPYAGDMRNGLSMYLALRFPERNTGVDWLVIGLLTSERVTKEMEREGGKDVRRDVLRGATVFAVRRHPIRRVDLERRNGTAAGQFAERTVAVLGLGALGGDVADALGKAGVGNLILVDFDTMRPGNAIRHVAGLAATGLVKTDAVRQIIRQHNPYVRVESVPRSATDPLSH